MVNTCFRFLKKIIRDNERVFWDISIIFKVTKTKCEHPAPTLSSFLPSKTFIILMINFEH